MAFNYLEEETMFLGALVMFFVGLGGLGGLYWLWHLAGLNPNGDAAMLAVVTIFPAMGIPYIISIAFVCLGLQGLCFSAYEKLTGRSWDGL